MHLWAQFGNCKGDDGGTNEAGGINLVAGRGL